MTTLYYSTNSCSIGIRVLLEELGLAYDDVGIDFHQREQFGEAYGAVNPKRKVPALVRDDGSVLTEFPAIAVWLARSNPAAGLIPDDLEGQVRVLEALDFMVASVHMRGFTFVIVPAKFTANVDAQADLRAHGRAQVGLGFDRLSETLGGKDWLCGAFSIADAGLFFLTVWAHRHKIDLPANIAAHHRRMVARPAVVRAMQAEGLAAEL